MLQTCLQLVAHSQVSFKPGAKRVELATALDAHGHNYNSSADDSKHLDGLVLKSQVIDLPTSFAVGCLRGNRLVLSPLDEAVQMRPHLGHLDTAKKLVKEEADPDHEEKKPSFVTVSISVDPHCNVDTHQQQIQIQTSNATCAVQVQVQRRETERQAEQRLASFAYLSQTEAEEKWRTLNYVSPDSEVASTIWEGLMKPPKEQAPLASMPRPAYLTTLTAGALQLCLAQCES